MQSIHFRQIGTSIYQGPKRTPSLSMLLFALLLFTVLSLGIFFFSIDDWEVFSHIVLPITLIMLLFVAFFVFVILRIFSPRVKVDLQQHTISIPNPGTWISLLMSKVKAFGGSPGIPTGCRRACSIRYCVQRNRRSEQGEQYTERGGIPTIYTHHAESV